MTEIAAEETAPADANIQVCKEMSEDMMDDAIIQASSLQAAS